MIVALLLGREGSSGFPGKNVYPVLGRPLMAYPLLAAKNSQIIGEIFVSTDSPKIMEIGRKYGASIIERPPELCTSTALGEDAYVHGYKVITETLGKKPELLVLLFCNAATIDTKTIDEGITVLRDHPEYDYSHYISHSWQTR